MFKKVIFLEVLYKGKLFINPGNPQHHSLTNHEACRAAPAPWTVRAFSAEPQDVSIFMNTIDRFVYVLHNNPSVTTGTLRLASSALNSLAHYQDGLVTPRRRDESAGSNGSSQNTYTTISRIQYLYYWRRHDGTAVSSLSSSQDASPPKVRTGAQHPLLYASLSQSWVQPRRFPAVSTPLRWNKHWPLYCRRRWLGCQALIHSATFFRRLSMFCA